MVSLARLIYALAISEAPLAISISCEELDRLINSINKSDRDSICYGWRWCCWDREERVEGSGGDERATVPAELQYLRVLFTWWWRWLGL